MYAVLLMIHSLFRWLVLLLLAVRAGRGVVGFLQSSTYGDIDRKLSLVAVIAVDIQLLLGIVLYAISPIIAQAMADPGAAMKNSTLRLLFVEHPFTMILGVVFVHVGHAIAKRASRPDASRHRIAGALTLFALLLILSRIPW